MKLRFIAEFGSQTYKFWIEPLAARELDNNTLELKVPNVFFSNWIRERYVDKMLQLLKDITGLEYKIKIALSQEEALRKQSPGIGISANKTSCIKTQIISKNVLKRLNPCNTFEEFVVGDCNKLAHAASVSITISPAKAYNPLFIYGGVGLGKTHLLHAVGQEIIHRFAQYKVRYLSSEEFTNQLIHAIQTQTTARFREEYRNVNLLLIDDIQFLAGKIGMQEEFFHTFNALYDAHRQIVITSDRPPKDISDLEERLVSRFHWGLVVDVQPPDFKTRLAILNKKALKFNLIIPSDILYYIGEKITSNIRELEGALLRVVAHATLIEEKINLSLTEKVLKDMVAEEKHRISIPYIQEKTAEFFNIPLEDIKGRSRKKNIALSRQIAIYFSRKYTENSLADIGRAFGGKDHTTVIHAVNKIKQERSGRLKIVINNLENKLSKNLE